jgi:hypothetical protein
MSVSECDALGGGGGGGGRGSCLRSAATFSSACRRYPPVPARPRAFNNGYIQPCRYDTCTPVVPVHMVRRFLECENLKCFAQLFCSIAWLITVESSQPSTPARSQSIQPLQIAGARSFLSQICLQEFSCSAASGCRRLGDDWAGGPER